MDRIESPLVPANFVVFTTFFLFFFHDGVWVMGRDDEIPERQIESTERESKRTDLFLKPSQKYQKKEKKEGFFLLFLVSTVILPIFISNFFSKK